MARVGAPHLSRAEAERTIEVFHECLEEGFPLEVSGGGAASARSVAPDRLGIATQTMYSRLRSIERNFDMRPDPGRYRPKPKALDSAR